MPLLAKSRTGSLRRLRAGFVWGLAATLITSASAHAQGLIRDAETEALLRLYAKPIFDAAGLGSQDIRIHIINDRNFNAFVVDGHNMFMHAGALMVAKTPNQVIGVIAHESGHITGGHLARLRTQVSRAKSAALMAQLIGLAAMAGGALAGAPGVGQAGMGAAFGGTDAAMRTLLAYRQNEESSADQAAVTFLNATKQSGRGMLETFEYMGQKLVGVQGINPYLQSHPLPQQRLIRRPLCPLRSLFLFPVEQFLRLRIDHRLAAGAFGERHMRVGEGFCGAHALRGRKFGANEAAAADPDPRNRVARLDGETGVHVHLPGTLSRENGTDTRSTRARTHLDITPIALTAC